jgi:PKD repeat protein
LADTFKLHSRPGSKKTIYLDFDGHLLTKTAWNFAYNGGADIAAPAWDIDGNRANFSDTERTRIQQVWRRVAEDYAPFDVDVTTELLDEAVLTRASSADDVYGVRVLISPISGYFGNYGGFAYVGVFNQVGNYYKPALVFSDKLSNSEKYMAEAVSHEAGHTLGLSHDGTTTGAAYYAGHGSGDTSWAPIMGNSYSRNVTQWSKGEYANANNLEDDLAIIGSRLAPAADEVGGTPETAGYLESGTDLSMSGMIGLSGDEDVIAFAAGSGAATLSVLPMGLGPNLDVAVDLLDADGGLVASSNPTTGLGASLGVNLSAGTYFVRVRGVGVGDPKTTGYSAYASKGYYTLSGTVADAVGTVPPVAVAAVSAGSYTCGSMISLDGTGSFDQDGSLVTYTWDLGDGTSANGPTATHVYSAAGSYPVTLTVTDDDGLTASDVVVLEISNPNVAPSAEVSVSPTTVGTAPLGVTLDGSGSSDPDGSIVSHVWSFGDGTPDAGGAMVSHTYEAAGDYTATLTVTDNQGATATRSVAISVTEPQVDTIRVQFVRVVLNTTSAGTAATATVTVTEPDGTPVAGASVVGKWSGVVQGTGLGVTGADGTAVLVSKRVRKTGSYTFTVSNLAKAGFVYDASMNVLGSASATK